MDSISLLIALIGISISVYFYWKEKLRVKQARSELEKLIEKQPGIIANQLKKLLQSGETEKEGSKLGGRPNKVSFEDVNGDGQNELLVQYPGGVHGSELKVFGWEHGAEFVEIGSLGVGTPVGFKVFDWDGDGLNEIVTEETDWDAGKPYVTAPRTEVVYKWQDKEFIRIK